MFDERHIESGSLTQERLSESAIARIRDELASEGEDDCIDCGEQIDPRRKAALPSAERCISCQAKFERGGA